MFSMCFFPVKGRDALTETARSRWVFLQCGLEEVMEPEGKRVEPGKWWLPKMLMISCLFVYYFMNIVWDEIPVIIVGRWSEIDYMAIDFPWLGITQLKQISTREIEVMDHQHANEIAGICPCCFLEGWKGFVFWWLLCCYVVCRNI